MDELTFEQFEQADLSEWLERSNAEYVDERVASGDTLDEGQATSLGYRESSIQMRKDLTSPPAER